LRVEGWGFRVGRIAFTKVEYRAIKRAARQPDAKPSHLMQHTIY